MADELRLTPALTSSLISRVITDACTRLQGMARAGKAARLDRSVRAEAWIDAAFVLIELELPAWRPCRLIYDSGEWVCSLSRHPEIPFDFDDTVDGRHQTEALAILLSFVEAKRLLATIEYVGTSSVPQVAPDGAAYTFCCDNFG